MSDPIKNVARQPVDRAYRIIALGKAIEIAIDALEGETAARADAVMAIRHSAETINDEASAIVDDCDKAEAPRERAIIASVDVARVYDTLTLTKGLFEAAYVVAENRLELLQRSALDAAIYAIEEKVTEAEEKLNALIGRPAD